ncbi:MRG/MORF4L-binding protein-like [Varroa jacobsoni]|uniref:MRG/MORF4L-binding protein-like n=1 Tax=Varroa jacobsoni TaxID=62625 RepID=UPI000BF89636|nr:MRG/MORF4L-binding protein-like [Varroa jacobsoni]
MPEQSPINWSSESGDLSLLVAMVGYKPVGVGKHFQMLFIHDKFCRLVNKEMPTRVLWDRLDEMYDLEALDKSEIAPFPNSRVRDFELPDDEFGSGSEQEEEDEEDDSDEENEAEVDTRGKDGGQPQPAAAKPAATGGKTGKGHNAIIFASQFYEKYNAGSRSRRQREKIFC